jgi:UDP-N-acetylmuramoyl-L-alanyl-D-glutamate--2,6-diaminopimelate ligase
VHLSSLAVLVDAPVIAGDPSTDVRSVVHDSRAVAPGSLFCCVSGAAHDGHDFAAEAVAHGATALLVERRLDVDAAQLLVASVRPAMATLASAVNNEPSTSMDVVGITGTNGKTTVAHLVAAIFAAAGRRCAVSGTLSGRRTTPESPELQAWMAQRRDEGFDSVAMEVSSHALDQHRVDATRFAAAVFTNLSRDHLDYHESMEAYFRAKARLFEPEFTSLAVVNRDDAHGRLLADAARVRTVTYGLDEAADLVLSTSGSTFVWRGQPVRVAMVGRFNVSNALAAATTAAELGIDPEHIVAGLADAGVVAGRAERVDEGQPFEVLVDFAHTPDGLQEIVATARELAGAHRVHLVFGCGGGRDQGKRGLMGAAASEADRVVLTADNSRGEDTGSIIEQVLGGMRGSADVDVVVEPDRDRAIELALTRASPGDVVVIAGKGHETTQTIGDDVFEFDDREVARRHLRQLSERADA